MKKLVNKKTIITLSSIYVLNQVLELVIASTFDLEQSLASYQNYSVFVYVNLIINHGFFYFCLACVGYDVFRCYSFRTFKYYKNGIAALMVLTLPLMGAAIYNKAFPISSYKQGKIEQYSVFQVLAFETDLPKYLKVGDFRVYSGENISVGSLSNKLAESKKIIDELKSTYGIAEELDVPLVITKDNEYFKKSSEVGSCFGGAIFVTRATYESKAFSEVLSHEFVHYLNYVRMKKQKMLPPVFVDELIAYALEYRGEKGEQCSHELYSRDYLTKIYKMLNTDEQLGHLLVSPNETPVDAMNTYKYMFFEVFGCMLIKEHSLNEVFDWAVKTASLDLKSAFKSTFKIEMLNYIERTDGK